MKLFVYRHRDDPLKVAFAKADVSLILLWLWLWRRGYEQRPVYAIRVRMKQ